MMLQDNLIQGNIGLCATNEAQHLYLVHPREVSSSSSTGAVPSRPTTSGKDIPSSASLAASNGSHETMAAGGLHQVEHGQSPRPPTPT